MRYSLSALLLCCGEGLAWGAFTVLNKAVGPRAGGEDNKFATRKGILERLTVVAGLLYGFPHILTAFAALKIGTRFRENQNCRISNTYFLSGNLMSLLLAMTYAVVLKILWH